MLPLFFAYYIVANGTFQLKLREHFQENIVGDFGNAD